MASSNFDTQNTRPSGDALQIKGLSLAFGRATAGNPPILDHFDLNVRAGEFVAIVGPSGCGKSTVLNVLAGLASGYHRGTVLINGAPVSGVHAQVGYMFQSHGLLPWRTICQNVAIGLELRGVPPGQRRAKALALLEQVGLARAGDLYPAALSGGMRQRAALARTLATDPAILLMDEPFGALDAQTKILVQNSFLSFWERDRRSVLFVTHDLDEALCMADRVLVMSSRPGRIIRQYPIPFARPRNVSALRSTREYGELWRSIWEDLRPVETAEAA